MRAASMSGVTGDVFPVRLLEVVVAVATTAPRKSCTSSRLTSNGSSVSKSGSRPLWHTQTSAVTCATNRYSQSSPGAPVNVTTPPTVFTAPVLGGAVGRGWPRKTQLRSATPKRCWTLLAATAAVCGCGMVSCGMWDGVVCLTTAPCVHVHGSRCEFGMDVMMDR